MTTEIAQTLITTLGSITVAIITVMVKTRMDERKAKTTKEKEETIQEVDLEEMVIVQEWLESLVSKYDFARLSIFQFHNGGKFFQGKSMKKFSMTYEAVYPGYEKIKRAQQNILTSEYPKWLTRMMKSDCFSSLTVELEQRDRIELEAVGVKQFVTIPIRCIKGHLIGFMVGYNVSSIDENINEKSVSLIEEAKFISGYIS